MRNRCFAFLSICLLAYFKKAVVCALSSSECSLLPYGLAVEHLGGGRENDVATIDPEWSRSPRFSFKAKSPITPAPEAIASHVQVIRNNEKTSQEIVWDSGWMFSSRRAGIDVTRPQGQLEGLVPMEELVWRARFGINGTDGNVIGCLWSNFSRFIVGPSAEVWEEADWICAPNKIRDECDFYDSAGQAAAPFYRSKFDVGNASKVSSARLFVTGLGFYEAWMNGYHLNQGRYMDPAPASYDKRVYYNSFDVTNNIQKDKSEQVLGFHVGSGWYNPLPMRFWGRFNLREALTVGTPRVRCILVIEYEDDQTPRVIFTTNSQSRGNTWETVDSGLLRNDLYIGNIVDLDRMRFSSGWSTVDFDSPLFQWRPVVECPGIDSLGTPDPQPIPPIRSRPPHSLKPISIDRVHDDLIFDMGLNSAAAIHVEIVVPEDWVCSAQQIELKYGEILSQDGTVNGLTSVAGQIKTPGCCGPCAPDIAYQRTILRTTKTSQYTTQFSWSAFRYIQVSALPPGWKINVTAIPLMTDLAWTTSFVTSNTFLNRLFNLCQNTHASNMLGIQSDCPHRERFGYTGDALATLETSLLLFDGSSFYEKRLYDVVDAIRQNGGVTETAPFVGIATQGLGGGSGPIGWQSLFPILQRQMDRYFGNTQAILNIQRYTQKWIDFILSNDSEIEGGLGDWMATDKMPAAISGRIFLIEVLRAWAILAISEDERAAARSRIRFEVDAFRSRFLNRTTGDVSINGTAPTQAGQAMSLYYHLIPDTLERLVMDKLVEMVHLADDHITAGMFGVLPVFESLTRANRSDLAWKVATQTTFPSYGHMLKNNATTLWESWFWSNDTYSHNHPMFSGVVPWILRHIGGIYVSEAAIGADRLVFAINPPLHSKLKFANFTLETIRGQALCAWRCLADGRMEIQISCPINSRGLVKLPDGSDPFHIRGGDYGYRVQASACLDLLLAKKGL